MKLSNRRYLISASILLLLLSVLFFVFTYNKHKTADYHPMNRFRIRSNFAIHVNDVKSDKLGHYYIDSNGKPALDIQKSNDIDSNGVHCRYMPGVEGKVYHHGSIAQYALEIWALIQDTHDSKQKERFIEQADWLVTNQIDGKWIYNFDFKEMHKPWISAMDQGQCISVLLRAYQLTKDQKYYNSAEKAFGVLKVPVESGGVLCKVNQDKFWFEEYPNPTRPSHVMDGHIFTLFGIWDFYRMTKNQEALSLFTKGSLALKSDLSKYDRGERVMNDQNDTRICNCEYLDIIIRQLEVLNAIAPDPIYSMYITKFETYLYQSNCNYIVILYKEALQKRNYTEALNEIRPLSQKGDAMARYLLGLMYASGHGLPQNHSEAVRLIRDSADQGLAIAQNKLGEMYINGHGVQQDYAEA